MTPLFLRFFKNVDHEYTQVTVAVGADHEAS